MCRDARERNNSRGCENEIFEPSRARLCDTRYFNCCRIVLVSLIVSPVNSLCAKCNSRLCNFERRGRRYEPVIGSCVNVIQGLECWCNFGEFNFQYERNIEKMCVRCVSSVASINTEIVFVCLQKFELTEITLVPIPDV